MSKKDQLGSDEEEAKRLQAEFNEEERLAREKDEANVALTKEWDDIQAKIKADHELAQRLQVEEQEELSVKEKAKLFQQLLEQRRKHFTAKKSTKKQKVDEDKDTSELQSLMEVIPDEEEVAIDVVPKPPTIYKVNAAEGFNVASEEVSTAKFSMKDMRKADVIRGINIKHKSNRIAISQSYYIEKVVSQVEYSMVIGYLMYAMTCIRSDIAFVMGKLSSYLLVLEVFTDASYISNTEYNSSTSGWVPA
ncbi:hypothetical protein Tco_0315534 [Tanacetum coccineum]